MCGDPDPYNRDGFLGESGHKIFYKYNKDVPEHLTKS